MPKYGILDRLIRASQRPFENNSKVSQARMYNIIHTLLLIIISEIIFKTFARKTTSIQSGVIIK